MKLNLEADDVKVTAMYDGCEVEVPLSLTALISLPKEGSIPVVLKKTGKMIMVRKGDLYEFKYSIIFCRA